MCQQSICKCGFDSCLNGGLFIASTCSCICPLSYTGSRCDNLIYTTTTTKTTTTTITTTTTTLSMTTTVTCPILPCQNGAKINLKTCKCDCMKNEII